jgi:type III pantothenate kinase
MTALLVDIGNSRVKWARLSRGALGEQHAAAHGGWTVADWRTALFAGAPVERVLASTVAGGASGAALGEAARLATGRDAVFAATGREAAGVLNGYADPSLLGVDRWLAVIGAYRRVRGACVIADAGTAATIDVVAADGRHRGGFIVPGPALMVSSLLRGTSDLALRRSSSPMGTEAGFADNTRDAIERGCRVALAALVDRCVADAATVDGAPPVLLLTGGAAGEIRPHLRTAADHVPDLVLRGLAALVECGGI